MLLSVLSSVSSCASNGPCSIGAGRPVESGLYYSDYGKDLSPTIVRIDREEGVVELHYYRGAQKVVERWSIVGSTDRWQ